MAKRRRSCDEYKVPLSSIVCSAVVRVSRNALRFLPTTISDSPSSLALHLSSEEDYNPPHELRGTGECILLGLSSRYR